MIETKKFNLTQKEYTKIIVQKRFKKSWWLYLIVFIAAILNAKQFGKDNFSTFFVIFGFAYPFLSMTSALIENVALEPSIGTLLISA